MTTLTKTYKPYPMNIARTIKIRDRFINAHLPRRCMLVSTGLILAGLSLPVLMVLDLLPVTFSLGFVGLVLVASGSVMALTFCGEI